MGRLRLHQPERLAGAEEGAGQVGIDDLGELILGHPHQQGVVGDACVGDHHLDRTLVLGETFTRDWF